MIKLGLLMVIGIMFISSGCKTDSEYDKWPIKPGPESSVNLIVYS
jgi:hypothetical protein